MTTITLETLHQEILGLQEQILSLRECLHEDLLELSLKTKEDIEESRRQIKDKKFVKMDL